MEKFFNTDGPVNPAEHYCLPPASRLNEDELRLLIAQKKYFILHAPRQTGKTTTMRNFAQQLNAEGKYKVLYVNVEAAQSMRNKVTEGLATILAEIHNALRKTFGSSEAALTFFKEKITAHTISGNELSNFLTFWAEHEPKPIVLFIDEIDSLVGDTLVSVLRQLRAGYTNRPSYFPQSACLIGVRDVRDYRIWSDTEQKEILGGSAFNIKSESLRMADFTKENVRTLYLQHTQETGQRFDDEAIAYAFEQTQGQPWLVNALAYQACFRDIIDRSKPITKEVLERAKEELIRRRDVHLNVLIDRLSEPRVRVVIDAIINSTISYPQATDEDISYSVDLGLIKQDAKNIWIANPIYQEILPRALSQKFQYALSGRSVDYVNPDGKLNMNKLLEKFTEFYRESSDVWLEKFDYKEAGPHLLLMAFLQRVINACPSEPQAEGAGRSRGGGKIHREYALGTDRVDLLITWKQQRIVVELKVWYNPARTLVRGLEKTAEYMDTANATEGHLVIFDRRPDKSWDEKIYTRQERVGNKTITVWGL